MQPHPLARLPVSDLPAEQADPRISRYLRVFGDKRLLQLKRHLNLIDNGIPWFAFVAHNDAKYFTRFKKLANPVKNPRSITGSQKYIANARNDGFIF